MTIKIYNLGLNISDSDLERIFNRFGIVNSAEVDRNKFNGRSKGNAMVVMPIEKEARQAITSLDQTMVDGKKISVSEFIDTPKW